MLQLGSELGLSPAEASFLISMVGLTNTVGRICSGWLADRPGVSPLAVTLAATGAAALFPALLPCSASYPALLTISALFGAAISALPTLTSGLIVELLDKDKLNDAFGKHQAPLITNASPY